MNVRQSVLTVERVLLGVGIPLGGMFAGFVMAGPFVLAGLREPSVSVAGLCGVFLGIVVAAHLAPRVVTNAARFSLVRRIAAGVTGVMTLGVVGRCLPLLGLDVDALSHSPSAWGIVHEGVSMLLGYGSMLAAAYATLGRPTVASDPIA